MSLLKQISFLIIMVSIFTSISVNADNQVRGITERNLIQDIECVDVNLARKIDPGSRYRILSDNGLVNKSGFMGIDDWVASDSLSKEIRITEGNRYVLSVNGENGTFEEIIPEIDLSETVWNAIDRAPRWLRKDLLECMTRLRGDAGEFYQDMLAEIIMDAEDPIIDEIVFSICRTSPDLWNRGTLRMDLWVENAQGLYAADSVLNYVRIVDHGSAEDDNYWSSVEYNIKSGEDTIQVELNPEYYYWWIVHPKISDEYPLYINPASGRPDQPGRGVFWRDYLFNHADEDYPVLREMLEDCGVLWSNLRNNGTNENGAIGVVNQWARASMTFEINGRERPIQPVRIYALHMGFCGEWQDITAAASRAALIPTSAVMNIANDHVWNEFYAGRWIVWEPVNNMIDDSLRYDGWNEIPGIFTYRGDGYVINSTPRYTVGLCTLVVNIRDSTEHPVDGARIVITSESLHGGYGLATFNFTDSNGQAIIPLGDQRNIYLNVSTEIGRYPADANSYTQVIENSEDGAFYEWEWQFEDEMPSISIQTADYPENPVDHYRLILDYEPIVEYVYGNVWAYSSFWAGIYPPKMNLFICDEENYQNYVAEEAFEGHEINQVTEAGQIEFILPTDAVWYAVISNDEKTSSFEEINIEAYLTRDEAWSVPTNLNDDGVPTHFTMSQNYPNPFNAMTRIDFGLTSPNHIMLSIFDMNGREISEISSGQLNAGYHSIEFNAEHIESGVYIYRLKAGDRVEFKKMILLK